MKKNNRGKQLGFPFCLKCDTRYLRPSNSRFSKSGFCFRSKGNNKIENRKIAIEIEGFTQLLL